MIIETKGRGSSAVRFVEILAVYIKYYEMLLRTSAPNRNQFHVSMFYLKLLMETDIFLRIHSNNNTGGLPNVIDNSVLSMQIFLFSALFCEALQKYSNYHDAILLNH